MNTKTIEQVETQTDRDPQAIHLICHCQENSDGGFTLPVMAMCGTWMREGEYIPRDQWGNLPQCPMCTWEEANGGCCPVCGR